MTDPDADKDNEVEAATTEASVEPVTAKAPTEARLAQAFCRAAGRG